MGTGKGEETVVFNKTVCMSVVSGVELARMVYFLVSIWLLFVSEFACQLHGIVHDFQYEKNMFWGVYFDGFQSAYSV